MRCTLPHTWKIRGYMLPVTSKKHAIASVTALTTSKITQTNLHQRGYMCVSPPGDTRELPPSGMLPLLPQGMLVPPQGIHVVVNNTTRYRYYLLSVYYLVIFRWVFKRCQGVTLPWDVPMIHVTGKAPTTRQLQLPVCSCYR